MGEPLCPTTDIVPFDGELGTNLFVVPKYDYMGDEPENVVYWNKIKNSYVSFTFAHLNFNMVKYLDMTGDHSFPYDPAYSVVVQQLNLKPDT
jgi:hypothetical protein